MTNIEQLKEKIKARWKEIDKNKENQHSIHCNICKTEIIINKTKKYFSNCMFGGGILERYQCPKCGVIFGPLKMMNLTNNEFDNEYIEHYKIYKTKDHSSTEIKTFMHLNPNKKNTYINFGSGSLSTTVIKLRKMKYKVFGYEPYADTIKSNIIISNEDKINSLTISGIFSNNLIEHFRDPVKSFKYMKTILQPGSYMVHSTPCYNYSFDFTRFHLFFFTNDSIQFLCKQAGIKTYKKIDNKTCIFGV